MQGNRLNHTLDRTSRLPPDWLCDSLPYQRPEANAASLCFKKVIKSAPYLPRMAKALHVNGTSDHRECRKQAFQEPEIKSPV